MCSHARITLADLNIQVSCSNKGKAAERRYSASENHLMAWLEETLTRFKAMF
jgi:hypothetical protein